MDEKIIVIDRESFRKEVNTTTAIFGTTVMMSNRHIPTEVVKVLIDMLKVYTEGLEISLFGKAENDKDAAETAMKEDK